MNDLFSNVSSVYSGSLLDDRGDAHCGHRLLACTAFLVAWSDQCQSDGESILKGEKVFN